MEAFRLRIDPVADGRGMVLPLVEFFCTLARLLLGFPPSTSVFKKLRNCGKLEFPESLLLSIDINWTNISIL